MNNKINRMVLAGVASAAVLGIYRSAPADVVIGSWENLVVPPPPDPDPLPANFHRPIGSAGIDGTHDFGNRSVYANDTYGATNGAKSLKVQINPADIDTNRFSFNVCLQLQESGSVGTFLASSTFAIDVSWRNSDWVHSAGQNGYAGINQLVCNASGTGVGFADAGKAQHDTFREAHVPEPDSFKGFWDKSFGDETTTLSWDLTPLVNGSTGDGVEVSAVQASSGGGFVNIVISTVYDPAFSFATAAFYFDNARLIPRVITSEWTGSAPDPDGDGSNGNAAQNLWFASQNWTQGVPGAADSVAIFGTNGGALSGAQNVNTTQSTTVGGINFTNPAGYTIGGTGSITLDTSGGSASITVSAGNNTIGVPVNLAKNTVISSDTGTGISFAGNLTGSGQTLTKTGAGTAQFQNVRVGALNISQGSAKISAKGTANSAGGTSVVTSLSISGGASLDLTNNSMIVDYTGPVGTQVGDVRNHLKNARLITSSGTATTRIGYGDNAVLGKTTFAGQSVDTSSILIKFTYAGDADLDGDADGVDIGTWATNFTGELGGSGSAVWTQGDWDYDGDVDGVDAGLWAQAFTGELGGAGLGSLIVNDPNIAPGAAAILRGMGITVVPEPGTVGLLAGLGVMAMNRRTRRRRQ